MGMGMGMEIDGLLIVDKPEGLTSLEVVKAIKSRLQVKRAGHIGTLDPFATGVLPVAINEGTRLIPFLRDEPKEYEAIVKLGEETSTDDPTGEVISRKPWGDVTHGQIQAVFQSFRGKIRQIPPMFSAVKIGGKPLYELARKGIEVERKEREVEIFNLRFTEIDLPRIGFRVSCSKGTYVRTLGKDMGRMIGCGAHLLQLRRVQSGPFSLDRAIPWKTVKDLPAGEDLRPWVISLRDALSDLPELIGDEGLSREVRLGRGIKVRDLSSRTLPPFDTGARLRMSSPKEELIAILKSEVKDTDIHGASPEGIALRPLRVFRQRGTAAGGMYGACSRAEERDYRPVQNP
jgi:tRNA pseudouridine55 synthase